MTPQETIETMKIAIAEVEWNYPMEYAVAFENAISALEKQIPKKPLWGATSNASWRSCPSCHSREYKTFKYCSKCGQALDWSDSE